MTEAEDDARRRRGVRVAAYIGGRCVIALIAEAWKGSEDVNGIM